MSHPDQPITREDALYLLDTSGYSDRIDIPMALPSGRDFLGYIGFEVADVAPAAVSKLVLRLQPEGEQVRTFHFLVVPNPTRVGGEYTAADLDGAEAAARLMLDRVAQARAEQDGGAP